jgi:hypothetical protein
MGLLEVLLEAGRAGKNALLAKSLQEWLNMHADFGKVTDVKLDARAKRLEVVLELKGEAEPVSVTLHDYRIKRDGERLSVEVGRVTASREWIAILAQRFLANRPFRLPVPAEHEWIVGLLV